MVHKDKRLPTVKKGPVQKEVYVYLDISSGSETEVFPSIDKNMVTQSSKGRLVRKIVGTSVRDRMLMLKKVRSGLNSGVIEILEHEFDASQKELAAWLSIPSTTLSRRKKTGKLKADESDRAVRYARIRDMAVDLMQGDKDAAISWLRTPKDILGGESPLEHATTEIGARDVEDLMGRIQHGVFS